MQAALDELGKRFPEGLKARVFYDSSSFVAATIDEVEKTLGIAFALVVLVVFLFLGNLRATIIPMVAIPVSLIGTFAVLLAVGFSANTVSLLALVLGIGVVVDDAIVVVENVERVMAEEPDLPPGEATKKAMRQITGPVIAISLVLLSVFVPIALHPRRVRLVVPPVRRHHQRGDADLGDQRADAVAGAVRRVPAPSRAAARPAALGARRHRQCAQRLRRGGAPAAARVDPVGGAADRGAASASGCSPRARRPGSCRRRTRARFFVAVQLPDGASVSRTRAVVQQIEGLIGPMPQVQGVLSIVGFSLLDGGNEPNAAFVVVRLKPFADRTAAADSAQAVIGRVFGAVQQMRSANVVPVQPAADHRAFDQRRLRIPVGEPGRPRSRRDGERDAGPARRGQPGPALTRVFSTFTASNPSIWLDIDREKAQALGLNIADVFNALQSTLGGFYVNDFNLFGRTWQVNIQGNAPDRSDISAIYKIYVRNQTRRDGAAALDRRICASCSGRR